MAKKLQRLEKHLQTSKIVIKGNVIITLRRAKKSGQCPQEVDKLRNDLFDGLMISRVNQNQKQMLVLPT